MKQDGMRHWDARRRFGPTPADTIYPPNTTRVGLGTAGTRSIFEVKAPMVPGALRALYGAGESYGVKPG